jgi:predicted GH43/DUF377 family glycosyl hydrolase
MDIAKRFNGNPILSPGDIRPSAGGLEVVCALNPGAFEYDGKIWLAVRVAERPPVRKGAVSAVMLDPESRVTAVEFDPGAPGVDARDPRVINKDGVMYLTTVSQLRLFVSGDGEKFGDAGFPPYAGSGSAETFGVEDVRVAAIEGKYCLTYTAVSGTGCAVGLALTTDWKTFDRKGIIFKPTNKDCAVFPERIRGRYICLNRPSADGGSNIWLAASPDLVHWEDNREIVRCRPGRWDSARIGANGPPFRVPGGWLALYHGADRDNRYCLGALLLDARDPAKVLARSAEPVMEPVADYECKGFFGNVVFSNGQVVRGDDILLYYGASDEYVCGARLSIKGVLAGLA